MNNASSRSWRILLPLALLGVIAMLIGALLVAYRPDRPVATILPGSSSRPSFVVQIIRPRVGLPLGGILPPELFGLDEHLGFETASPGAAIGTVGPERLELSADGWELVIVTDAAGRVTHETQVVFELVFEDRKRKIRCRPAKPAVGMLETTVLSDGELSGHFDIELNECEDAKSGKPLDWPSEPLRLYGSFDRLP